MANVKATDLIDFTRASKGHALAKVSYGPELVANGTFDTDASGWNALGNSTISVSNGEMIVSGDGGYNDYAQDLITTEAGKLYSVEATGRSITGNMFLAIKLSVSPFTTLVSHTFTSTSPETVKLSFFAGGPTTQVQFIQYSGSAGSGALDNISVKEVTFDQPDGTIQLFEHPNNTPRIEYDADGNLLGLLIEEARTNTIQYSEDFENSYWGKGGGFSIYGNNGIAPDGTRTATLLTGINDDDSYIIESNICSNGQTKSVWIRTVSGTATLNVLTRHNQLDGEVTVTEEWQRFERAVDISEPGGDDFFIFDTRSGTNTASDIYIWGAQLETGAFATSYIRSNSGSSTSRSADVASINVDQFGYNQSEGTITVKAKTFSNAEANHGDFALTDGASSPDLMSGSRTGSSVAGTYSTWYRTGGITQANLVRASAVEDNVFYKASFCYKANDFAQSVDGGSILSDSSGTVPSRNAVVLIGDNFYGKLNGHIKSLTYTPKRLSNAKLQELTS